MRNVCELCKGRRQRAATAVYQSAWGARKMEMHAVAILRMNGVEIQHSHLLGPGILFTINAIVTHSVVAPDHP